MRIFITGGTGFVGTFVVRRLLRGNHKLMVLSRDPRREKDLFEKSRKIRFVKGGLSNAATWAPPLILHPSGSAD